MGLVPQGGSCEEGNISPPWEGPSPEGRSAWTEGVLRRLRGECSNQFAEGKTDRDVHRWLVPPPYVPQPEMLICWYGQGLDAEALALEVRPRERTKGWLQEDSLKRMECGS